MRLLLLLSLLGAALAAAPAQGAERLDPSRLVLHRAELPAGFAVDRDDTGLRTNELETKDAPALAAKLVAWGRLTGYEAEFDRSPDSVSARIDVYRTAKGPERQLALSVAELRKSGITGLERTRLALGDGGWLYATPAPGRFAVAVWRHGRVFAGVAALGLTRARTLALARAQERRIAAALR